MSRGPYFGFGPAEKYSGLSRRTLGRRLSEISHIRVGGRVLFTEAGLDEFLRRHAVALRPERKLADVDRIVAAVRCGRRGKAAVR